ncbi:hypothetical protein U1Q18_018265 [Sarracenia purpurea var. burkii]
MLAYLFRPGKTTSSTQPSVTTSQDRFNSQLEIIVPVSDLDYPRWEDNREIQAVEILHSPKSAPNVFEKMPQKDTHDPKGHYGMVLSFLKERSKIMEIVAAHCIVFALAQSDICVALSRETNHVMFLSNVSPDEVIRSLFHNKNNDSLITISGSACRMQLQFFEVQNHKNRVHEEGQA